MAKKLAHLHKPLNRKRLSLTNAMHKPYSSKWKAGLGRLVTQRYPMDKPANTRFSHTIGTANCGPTLPYKNRWSNHIILLKQLLTTSEADSCITANSVGYRLSN
ncbi:unnamed protein product [Meganyctiphanes norvegica]|uniref:Uncharacterized protein n=1 Tax=Meganyctiphanes norvegica TaxID=48144 RepID=A0AAV2RFD9_MEGNR